MISPEHETFGRDVPFEDIRHIKELYQPGILDITRFFNPTILDKALQDICYFPDDQILVYFRNIGGQITPQKGNKNWWDLFQEFVHLLGEDFPGGLKTEYWYGSDGKERSSPKFEEKNSPYQAFAYLFDNAIQAFSCFVREQYAGISFSSERSNYRTIKPGEGLHIDQKTLWKGTATELLLSAVLLSDACRDLKIRTNDILISGHNGYRCELRIISSRGALAESLVMDSSVTLRIDNKSLEETVKKYDERKRCLAESLAD